MQPALPSATQVGATISCRVLQVDPKKRKIHMTFKTSMVKDKGVHICSYEDAKPGMNAVGFVTRISTNGVTVTFYGNVHGLVPARALHKHGIDDLESAFTFGQVSL